MERDYFQEALQTFNNGNWYLFKKDWTGATMPSEEEVNAKIQELKDAETQKANDKISAHNKLKALGLTDAEIKAL